MIQFIRRAARLTGKCVALLALAVNLSPATAQTTGNESPATVSRPKLVVVLVVDGLPQEQVIRLRPHFEKDGFGRFFRQGAVFLSARYTHATTFTASGHATIFTGAHPYRHGVIANDWFDRKTKSRVYSAGDPAHTYLDASAKEFGGTSPCNLEVTTIGDELRAATDMRAKVFGVSLKDRSAILPAGKLGSAYFYDWKTGRFITSSYYRKDYPDWWSAFHQAKPQDKWFGKRWEPVTEEVTADAEMPFPIPGALKIGSVVSGGLDEPSAPYYAALASSPFGDEYVCQFVEALVEREKLGRNPGNVPDLLAISFSCHDAVNHTRGPESRESADNLLHLDQQLSRLFAFLDKQIGANNLLLVLTSDHGFSNSPEYASRVLRLDAGRIDPKVMLADLSKHLGERFGEGASVLSWWTPTVYLDYDAIIARKLDPTQVERVAADFLSSYPGIHTVFTRTQLLTGQLPRTEFAAMAARSWHAQRSGDLFLIPKPCWYLHKGPKENLATHGTPWAHDTHVPVMFWGGKWIQPGSYTKQIEIVDIAPTLATILGTRLPNGSEGRVLHEMLPQ
jgi:predicted AlkP superfamily pyrophosphatase or phosphodiesterase